MPEIFELPYNNEVLVFDEVYLIPIIICSFADLISSLVILTVSEA